MSGGVDSAVAALLVRRSGAETVAVTLELWADPENDGERCCCSASAVRTARAVAHGMGLPHLTLDLREPFRAGVVAALPRRPRGRPDAQPVRALQRPRAPRRDARPRRAHRGSGAGHRPLRARDAGRAAAARRRPGEGPDVHARGALAGQRRAHALPARRPARSPRCARSPPRPACRSPPSPTRRTCASSPAPGAPRSSRATAACASAPATIVDRRGAELGRHRGHHHFTVGQRRGLRVGGTAEPLYVLATDARANTVTVGPREALAASTVAVRGLRLHRPEDEVDQRAAALPLAGRALPRPRRRGRAARAVRGRRARPDRRVPAAATSWRELRQSPRDL